MMLDISSKTSKQENNRTNVGGAFASAAVGVIALVAGISGSPVAATFFGVAATVGVVYYGYQIAKNSNTPKPPM